MIIVLNNKSNFNKEEFLNYMEELSRINYKKPLILCPSTSYLSLCSDIAFGLGSQNVSKDNLTSRTGEITATQLKSLGVSYCIVGHSDRRINNHETDEYINCQINNLLSENIIPILCVGESKEEYDKNITKEVILNEIQSAIRNTSYDNQQKIIVAYEPIWAIGSKVPPMINEIEEVVNFIKSIMPNNKVLYGGGITNDNIFEITDLQNIDGLLIGSLGCNSELLKNVLEIIDKK